VGSNPRPADYEEYGLVLRTHYLHRYHGIVPPIALIASLHGWFGSRTGPRLIMAIIGCKLQNVTVDRGLVFQVYGRRATWPIWTSSCSLSIV
jgi:hypothetical protein